MLPEWAQKMTDAEWLKQTKKHKAYTKCKNCNARLIVTLCDYSENRYCVRHCPEHKWQTTHDWAIECARCGISYIHYLEDVLTQNKITFIKYRG